MQIASKVWNFIKPRQKFSLATFVIVFALVAVVSTIIFFHFGVDPAHAQQATTPANSVPDRGILGKVVDIIGGILLAIAQLFIQITIFILRFVIEVGAYNGYIDATAVNYGWIMVRDVTNMFFVIILLIVAFGTILGLEQYEYKKLLFKLIAAAVIVNFSRTICGLIIDLAQVIMVTFINGVAATAGGNLINMFSMQEVLSIARTADGKSVNSTNVFLASVAALTFSAMAMATMAVFLIMLVARLITLWILIVLSPLAFVLSVIPQTQKYASQWWTEFGNNVAAGPIIAFFLWLAFVTAGSGNANDDIVAGLANKDLSVSGSKIETVGSSSAGISKAMEWNKMASFVIAIGMLLVGAKVAQQLGAVGGAMMGKAVDFGKKAAMMAGGITAARWAGRRAAAAGKAAGKFVAMKAPLVGGEAWQRRGRAIAGRVQLAMGKLEEYRNVKAKELEEKKGVAGFFGKMGARLIESGGRKMKRATDWQEAAKTQKKVVEEMYGVGGARGGIERMRGAIRLEKAEEMGAAAKEEAKEKERMRMRAGVGEAEDVAVRKAEKQLKEAKKQLAVDQKSYDEIVGRTDLSPEKRIDMMTAAAFKRDRSQESVVKREEKFAEAKKKAEERSGASFAAQQYALRAKAALEGKASAEIMRKQRERDAEIQLARAQDELEGKRLGITTTARADQVRAKHAKEDVELESVASFDKSMLKVGEISKQINRLKDSEKPEDVAMREELKTKLANVMQANVARGSEFGLSAMDKALENLGVGRNKTSADMAGIAGLQANILAAHLGRKVEANADAVAAAIQEMENNPKFGPAYMEQMMDRFNHMASDNGANYAGLFKLNDQGRVVATRSDNKDDMRFVQEKRAYALSAASGRKKGVDGSIDHDENGKAMIVSAQAAANLAEIFRGLTLAGVKNIDRTIIQGIAKALDHQSSEIEKFTNALRQSGAQTGAVESILKQIKKEMKTRSGDVK